MRLAATLHVLIWDIRKPSYVLTSNHLHLCNSVRVTEYNTDLGRGGTLTSELAYLLDDLIGGGLEPWWRLAAVWDGRARDTLSIGVL